MQTRVRQNFMRLREDDPCWHVVDAGLPMDEVTRLVTDLALKTVEVAASRPLGTLWPPR